MKSSLPFSRCLAFFFLLPLVFASLSLQQAEQTIVYTDCLRNATTELSETFTRSLNSILREFTRLSAQGNAYATTSTDKLYAFYQCRGDLAPQTCSNCIENVTAWLPLTCPLAVAARIRVDGCFLRYDNQPFSGPDTAPVRILCNTVVANNPELSTDISDAMDFVISTAPQSSGLFASVSYRGVYAMAQCWHYLTKSECTECLTNYPYHQSSCESTVGEQIHLDRCEYRFEMSNFLQIAASPLAPAPTSSSSLAQTPPPSPSAPAPASSSSLAQTPPSPSAPAALSSPSSPPGKKVWIYGICAAAGVIFLFVVACGMLLCWQKSKMAKGGRIIDYSSRLRQQGLGRPKIFSLKEMEDATDHFNLANKLGQGGSGVVFKGTLACGDVVAVKKLEIQTQRVKERVKEAFENELNLLTSAHHENVIGLLGYCIEPPARILVYEYLQNKGLDCVLSSEHASHFDCIMQSHGFDLFGFAFGRAGNSTSLTWSKRLNIIVGMAKGLQYLHEESESHDPIIHRDIKPSNILVDNDLNAVIADFGIARLLEDKKTHISTTTKAGTQGYMSPEYLMNGTLSIKTDVYSFGLVTLQLLTGAQHMPGNVLRWAWQKWDQGSPVDLADNKMRGKFAVEEVERVVQVALLCTQLDPKKRPKMSEVIEWLSGASVITETPIRPSYVHDSDAAEPIHILPQQSALASSTSSRSPRDTQLSEEFLSFPQSPVITSTPIRPTYVDDSDAVEPIHILPQQSAFALSPSSRSPRDSQLSENFRSFPQSPAHDDHLCKNINIFSTKHLASTAKPTGKNFAQALELSIMGNPL